MSSLLLNMEKNPKIEIETKNLIKATAEAVTYLHKTSKKKFFLPKSFFLMTHKILLAHNSEDAGKYRTARYELKIHKGTFKPTEAWKIDNEVVDLLDFINNQHKWGPVFRRYALNKSQNGKRISKKQRKLAYKVFVAWYIHHKLVSIHPFTDGNGRMARLIMCIVLAQLGLAEITYPVLINSIINRDKGRYLDALNKADRENYIAGINYMSKYSAMHTC